MNHYRDPKCNQLQEKHDMGLDLDKYFPVSQIRLGMTDGSSSCSRNWLIITFFFAMIASRNFHGRIPKSFVLIYLFQRHLIAFTLDIGFD